MEVGVCELHDVGVGAVKVLAAAAAAACHLVLNMLNSWIQVSIASRKSGPCVAPAAEF